MEWSNQSCLLTGASGGIGQAIAKALAQKGVSLVLVGRNSARLHALKEQLPGEHQVCCADLSNAQERESLVSKLTKQGGVSMLVNNAGISHLSTLEDTSTEILESVLQTNLMVPMLLTQALLPQLQQRRTTHIINIGSTFGSIGFAGQTAYCASKFGLRGFTESLLRELADTNIKVSYLAPRATDTQINSDASFAMNKALGNQVDTPEMVAKQFMLMLEQHKTRAFIGFPERLFVKLNGAFPSLVDKALIKKLPIIKRFIAPTLKEKLL
ncbi:SDR family oxidoreductase [Marinomonas atlantica]|uniref:SDR family oxidoreductase n=1 Tax=Marinomonas atlantica TaxID=1806668 RepID=UPI00083716A9|nr:SDR family oxidoreductase [Marinomonas atlantica]MCO4786214.1 SDR family oxidoreductase [Marinomonas atlantica]